MEIFKPEMLEKLVSGAVLGAIGGGTIGFIRGFLSGTSYTQKLNPCPECFDMDASAPKLFYEISKYRYMNEESYVEALHNMDALFCLEKQLLLKEIEPKLSDPPSATQMAIRTLTHLRALHAMIEDDERHKEMGEYINAVQTIGENHVLNVDTLCKSVTI